MHDYIKIFIWIVFTILNAVVLFLVIGIDENISDKGFDDAIKLLYARDRNYTIDINFIKKVKELESQINENVDPCVDFYQFACGEYKNRKPLIETQSGVYAFDNAVQTNSDRLMRSLEIPRSDQDDKLIKNVKSLYQTCLKDFHDDQKNLALFNKYLKQLGGWPILQHGWDENKFDWTKTMLKIGDKTYWKNEFLSLRLTAKHASHQKIIPDLQISIHSPHNLKKTRKFLSNTKNHHDKDRYFNYMIEMAMYLGAANETFAKQELSPVIQLESELIDVIKNKKVNTESSKNHSKIPHSMNVSTLSNNYPFFPWYEYLKHWLPIDVTDINFNLVIEDHHYLNEINNIIKSKPKKTLANYIIWKKIDAYAGYLGKTMRNYHDNFYNIKRRDTTNECLHIVSLKLPLLTARIYARDYFNRNDHETVNAIGNIVRNEFLEILKNSSWMDAEDREKVMKRLISMSFVIGYPQELLNTKKLEEFYKDLEFFDDSYIENILSINSFNEKISWRKLNSSMFRRDYWIDHGELTAKPQTFYDQFQNKLYIYAGILQDDFLNNRYPMYMNYGRIGFLIAHDIVNNFITTGVQIKKEGYFYGWKNLTESNLKNKTNCILEQYKKYTDKEISGRFLDEIIADNVGVKISYFAYKKSARNETNEKILNEMYTPKQMFWINTANLWCSNSKIIRIKKSKDDHHTKRKDWIKESFSNMKEFADDFNCPIDSPMNPAKKCILYGD